MRGRPPVPKAINSLRGDPTNRRRKTKEPKPPAGAPECPDYFDEVARAEWHDVCKQLDTMGLLSTADRCALELYPYARWRDAQAKVARFGAVIAAPKSGYPMKSAYASEMDSQFDKMRILLMEFGMTPSARSRLRVNIDDKPKSGMARLIVA